MTEWVWWMSHQPIGNRPPLKVKWWGEARADSPSLPDLQDAPAERDAVSVQAAEARV